MDGYQKYLTEGKMTKGYLNYLTVGSGVYISFKEQMWNKFRNKFIFKHMNMCFVFRKKNKNKEMRVEISGAQDYIHL